MTNDQPKIEVNVLPPVLFLDTPDHRALTEYVTQRSVYTLKKWEKKGLRIHTLRGEGRDGADNKNGNRRFIVTAEYLKFLETISE